MKKSFLVIGLSRFGLSVVKSLTDLGAEVIAVDINEEAVKKVAEYTEHCFICDGVVIEDLKANNLFDSRLSRFSYDKYITINPY